jgi:hypothetical protein
VTAGPLERTAAASRGHLRASHADRERVIDALKAAFVVGRLAKEEFDARIGQAFASRTCADLAAVTADLPSGPDAMTAVQSPHRPARALTRAEKVIAWGLYGIVLTVVMTIAVVPGPATIEAVVVTAAVIYSVFWLMGGLIMVAARHGWPRPSTDPPAVSQAPGSRTVSVRPPVGPGAAGLRLSWVCS